LFPSRTTARCSSAPGLVKLLDLKDLGSKVKDLLAERPVKTVYIRSDAGAKYGKVEEDPSRVAAQIVSGIGFIGAGIIFVKQDRVRGLTTAATVWLVTGVGMACGAGLPLLALAVTFAYFIVAFVFPLILRVPPGSPGANGPVAETERD
jgi:uncharacterized membrane protein YhiD involved in acid resistance